MSNAIPLTNTAATAPAVLMDDVQGIILRGYELLTSARFVLLEIQDVAAAKAWLGALVDTITTAPERPTEQAINVAFTSEGLKKLGLHADAFVNFSREFQEGMDTDHRNRVLGDTGINAPDKWKWGSRLDTPRLHILLMLYAKSDSAIQEIYAEQAARFGAAGLVPRQEFQPRHLPGRVEHFGFRDGIAQPFVAGVRKEPPLHETEVPIPENTIQAGEILLGYPNEYGKLPLSPTVPALDGSAQVDFGWNGSYLVFRQLSQNVAAFWTFLDSQIPAEVRDPELRKGLQRHLAAKIVGRWQSGAPLALSPDRDDPALKDADQYRFALQDPLGLRTPIGSHTRRSNPRDSLEPGPGGEERLSPEESLRVTKLHRIVRRGRPYGPTETDPDCGLLFLCMNANIARQFEFIQQTWINNPKFGGLYRDSDPLMGQRQPGAMNTTADVFTEQARPTRRQYKGLPDFVQVRGGSYFFLPGIQAIRYLAGLDAQLPRVLPEVLEDIPPDEGAYTAKLAEILLNKVRRDYPRGLVRRDAHPKHHGCVRAEFIIEPNLPPELQIGLFRVARSYPAYVRFSNQEGAPQADIKKDIRGMAIKIMGVVGPKLLDEEIQAQTQDFLLISHNAFVTRNVSEFYHLIRATFAGFASLAWFLINPVRPHFRVLRNLWNSLQRHANPLEIRYWSTTPYLFGSHVVKYTAQPVGQLLSRIPSNPSPNYLREVMQASLRQGEARFDFKVQFQIDPLRMPIEDPGVVWDESLSPFRKVATVLIPAQDFEGAAQMELAENLSFTPWHSLPEHRPLGGINRARRVVYRAVSEFRHQQNGTPREEPTYLPSP